MKIDADLRSFLRVIDENIDDIEFDFESCETVGAALEELQHKLPYEFELGSGIDALCADVYAETGETAMKAFLFQLPFYRFAMPPLRLLRAWGLETIAYARVVAALLEKQFDVHDCPERPDVEQYKEETLHRTVMLSVDVAATGEGPAKELYAEVCNNSDSLLEHVKKHAPESHYLRLCLLQNGIALGSGRGGQTPAKFVALLMFPELERDLVEKAGSNADLLALINGVLGVSADDVDPSS